MLAALAVRAYYGATKETFHIDEGYSAALTNGNWLPGMDPAQRDVWTTGGAIFTECFTDTLTASGKPDFASITDATAHDVHPPLYYWLFAVARVVFGVGRFAFAGYALNMILFAISCALFVTIARRVWKDWLTVFFALSIFAFSSTAISLTIFIRMYELLQTLCLAFFAAALYVLFPPKGKISKPLALAAGFAGLFVISFLGLMTQYYFLFFIVPILVFSFVYLLAKKRPASLLWGSLAVFAGLYLAYRMFPAMKDHLTKSYRAGQSFTNLAGAAHGKNVSSVWAYLKILSANLVPGIAILAVAVLAIVERVRKTVAGTPPEGVPRERTPLEFPVFILALSVFVFTFAIVSVSAPYQTARYIGAFFPVYAIAFAGFVRLVLSSRNARIMLGATALLVVVHGILPQNICTFHEDYPIDRDHSYMTDAKPLVILSSPEGASWKNILTYLNVGKEKRVFVAYTGLTSPVTGTLEAIARSSGEKEVYALVDDYISKQPAFKRIGYYGFFYVYRIQIK